MKKISKTREVAVVIFYDHDGTILIQDRTNKSGATNKYGFFGGGIEEGETPEMAIYREVREELGLGPNDIKFWKTSEYVVKDKGPHFGLRVVKHIFLSPLTLEVRNAKVFEGEKTFMKLADAVNEQGFSYDSRDLLDLLKSKIIL